MSTRRSFEEGPLADPEERQVVFATLDSFRQYRRNSHSTVTHRRRQNLYALPKHQWQVLAAPPLNLLDTLAAIDDALDCNADIADAILGAGLSAFGLPAEPEKGSPYDWHGTAKSGDLAKAHSTVRQFYRDWSFEGFTAEVEPVLKIVLEDLAVVLPVGQEGSESPSLLIPGAGLGRLMFALSLHGYNVEGNEISYHQLLASNFILNQTRAAAQFKLFPFISTFTNHKSRAHQLRSVLVPDIHPATAMLQCRNKMQADGAAMGSMNMTAGDFLTSYDDVASSDTFHAVVTIYFIDTAPNLIRYIETVKNCLKAGGVWVNVGPLLWHFDDRKTEGHKSTDGENQEPVAEEVTPRSLDRGIAEPGSFELTDEEVLLLLQAMGFEVLKHEYVSPSRGGYIQDSNSMVQSWYECSHWVARRLS